MDKIVARTRFFIDETKTALHEQNLRHLKTDMASLLDELHHLKEHIEHAGTKEQQKILQEHNELFTRLAVCFQYHLAPVEEEHLQEHQQEFFSNWYSTLVPQLNALKRLLEG